MHTSPTLLNSECLQVVPAKKPQRFCKVYVAISMQRLILKKPRRKDINDHPQPSGPGATFPRQLQFKFSASAASNSWLEEAWLSPPNIWHGNLNSQQSRTCNGHKRPTNSPSGTL
ncbi:hypothetical protein CB1_001107039 [Camelus ferus]|nr:hypothetical protein CB1_001107039 [Camelus ferus]